MIQTRWHLFRFFSLLLPALAVATSAHAADNYLKVIPSTALAWGAVNHMNEASDKIQKLAGIVQAPAVSVLDQLKTASGVTKGLDEKGAAGVFGVPGKTAKDASVGAFFIAISNEKEFLANFEVVKAGEKISEIKFKTPGGDTTTHCLVMRNGYALFSPKSDRAALEAAIEAKQDISAEMAGLESWLAENDAVVVGTAAGIKYAARQASEELKKAKASLGGDPNAAEDAVGAPGAALRPFLDLYGKVVTAMPSQIALAVAGIRCDKEGSIRVVGRARLVNGSLVSNAVAGIPPVKENLLAGIPGGSFIFAGGGVSVSRLLEGYMNLAVGLMKSMKSVYGMSADDLERMSKESLEVFRQVHSMNFVMMSGKRGDPIYSNMFSAMRVDNSQRVLDSFEKYTANANKLMQNSKGMLKSMTGKRLEIGGKPALQMEMAIDLSSMGMPEASRAIMDEMMGIGGKMLVYYVAADEHTVLMGIGVSQRRMVAALDVARQPKKSLAEDANVSVTAAMLPADAQWVAFISPRGYMQMTQRIMAVTMKNMPGAEGFSLPQFSQCPPVGFALKATPEELRAEIAVPAAMLQAAGEYVKDMQKMILDRAGQPNQAPAP